MKKKIHTNKERSVVFKRWNAKSYSVFNSLKKVIRITSLVLSYSIVVLPFQVQSQTDTTVTKNLDLEEVIVSAQRAPVVYSQLSRLVTTISDKNIQLMPVQSINEVLEYYSGIDIKNRGAQGIQSDISIRGGSFDQNLILLNGVNITDPQTGHHSLNLPIDLNSIERIEILEGPGSRVFGPNAFSGAINIITNQSENNYTKAKFTAGDFGLFSGHIATSYKIKNTKHFLSFSKALSNGYIKNTDFNRHNVFYNSNYTSDAGRIDFQLGYTEKAFGANSFYTPAYPDQYENIKTTFTSLRFETGNEIKIIPSVYFRRHQDRFELFRNEPASWYTGHNYHLTDVYGIKLDSRINSNFGISSFGAELRSENIWSNVLGEPMEDTLKAIGEPNGFYSRNYSRTVSNYFMEHSVFIGKISLTAGILASWVSENNFDFNIYPGFDLSYGFTKKIRTYATINKSLRLPTFTDLFYNGPSNIGNPNLKPEEAWSYELGIKLNNNVIQSNLSFFFRDAQNVIEWVRDTSAALNAKWETKNLTNVNTYGFSFNNRIDINKFTLNSVVFNYSYLNQSASAGNESFDTKYALNYLKHKFVINLNQSIYKFNFSTSFKFNDREGSYLQYDFNTNEYVGYKDFDPFLLVDAKLSYTYSKVDIFMEASNIFDVIYADIANVFMPGRWFKAGFNVQFNY